MSLCGINAAEDLANQRLRLIRLIQIDVGRAERVGDRHVIRLRLIDDFEFFDSFRQFVQSVRAETEQGMCLIVCGLCCD